MSGDIYLRTLVIAVECMVYDSDMLTGPTGLVPPALRQFADMLEKGQAGFTAVEEVEISHKVTIHTLHYTDQAPEAGA